MSNLINDTGARLRVKRPSAYNSRMALLCSVLRTRFPIAETLPGPVEPFRGAGGEA